MRKSYNNPDGVAAPVARYSHAVRVDVGDGALVFVCGQLPLDEEGNLVGKDDMTQQAQQAFQNIASVLRANGASMNDVVQTTTFVTDISRLSEVNAVRAQYFAPDSAPTSSTVEVTALARPDWLIEIEAVAAI